MVSCHIFHIYGDLGGQRDGGCFKFVTLHDNSSQKGENFNGEGGDGISTL